MLPEVGHRLPEVLQEQGGQILADPQADQDALHGYAGSGAGEGVGLHLPPLVAQPVGQVEQGVTRIHAVADAPGDGRDPGLRVAVAQELEGAQLDDLGGEVLAGRVGRVVNPPVPLVAKAQEVVVLRDDLPGRAGEVDLETGMSPPR